MRPVWRGLADCRRNVASVIGAFYYIRIVYFMYFGEAAEPYGQSQPSAQIALSS